MAYRAHGPAHVWVSLAQLIACSRLLTFGVRTARGMGANPPSVPHESATFGSLRELSLPPTLPIGVN